MRDMTEEEKQSIYGRGECPFCSSKKFFEGPSGGMSTNIECAGCHARLNVSMDPFGEIIEGPQCDACKRTAKDHAKDGKCLFDATHWTSPAQQHAEPPGRGVIVAVAHDGMEVTSRPLPAKPAKPSVWRGPMAPVIVLGALALAFTLLGLLFGTCPR